VSDDIALLEADQADRAEALDVSRSFIVQAPAGSGKTGLLIQRYLRLLAIVKSPENVLAITFTRKAALEMQFRVIDALRRSRDAESADSDHEKLTLTLAAEVLSRDKERAWNLIESPGRMRIETVDAFGAGIARSLPLSSGLGGIGSTAADAEMNAIYRDAATATLDYLATDDAAGSAVERVLLHLDNNTGLYVSYLARMLGSREQWLSITGSGRHESTNSDAARGHLERNIADVIDRQLKALDTLFPPRCRNELPELLQYAARNLIDDGKKEHALAMFASMTGMPSPNATAKAGWQAIANLMLTQKGQWRKRVNKNDGFPAGDDGQKDRLYGVIEAVEDLHDLRDALDRARLLPDPHYTDAQWSVLLALFDLLPLAVAELRRIFSERGVTDHNEVALAAGRALGANDDPGDMTLMLDYQVQHLLIDEMQDTSIGQYGLLKKLTAGWTPEDGRTIFCVGDPMQSIYRFRDAEVGEFLLARKNGIGNTTLETLTLRRNFRSGENLVHWFNTVFMQVMPLIDDIAVGAISYSESVPVESKAGLGEYHVHPLFGQSSDSEAQITRDVIAKCLDNDNGEDVAVLVRSRTQLSDLLPLLRRAGIEYKAVEIDRLTDLPEIIDLLALTRALCHEADRLAWLALLRGPWAGLCWKDILALVRNDTTRTVPELCRDPDRIAGLSRDGSDRVNKMLTLLAEFTARNASSSLRERVELAWFSLGGPLLLQDEEQLENVYRFFAAVEKIGMAGTLDDVRELESRLDDERVSSTVSSECRLQIMTMHKAKGLQFEHVVLPGLGRATRGGDKEVLNWLSLPDEEGRSELIISPVGARAELENDPLHRFIEATENEKTRMELDRLLYVACTRAKSSLHLIGGVGISPDRATCKRPDSRSLLSRLWPAIGHEYEHAFEVFIKNSTEAAGQSVDGTDYLVNPPLRRMVRPWIKPDAPELPGISSGLESIADADEKAVEFYWVGAAARHAGTIVHRWCQRISDGLVTVDSDNIDRLRPTSRRWAANLGVGDGELDEVCDRTEAALSGILRDEMGRWVLQGEGESELPVTGLFDGRIQSVVIDRIRIDDDGTHWIVDYKTSTHEGGDLAGFLEQEGGRYRPQLEKYRALYSGLTGAKVRTALYFPLLQQFREVETGS
jgi:ATP-dependent helicase/nuclease subunit A